MGIIQRSAAAVAAVLLVATAAAAEPVRIVNIGHSYYAAALYVAERAHLFEKHGLEPTVTIVNGGPLALQAVLSGNVDVGLVSYEHVLTAAVHGKRVISFFNLLTRPGSNVVASRTLLAQAKGLSLPQKIALLKGKRVAVPSQGGSGDKLARALIATIGGQPSDLSMVFSGSDSGSYVAALRRNLIDAAVVPEPVGLMVREQGLGGTYLNLLGGEVPSMRDMIYMSLVATPEELQTNRPLMEKVTAVFTDAVHLLKSDPKRALAIMKEEFPQLSDSMNRHLFAILNDAWSSDGEMTLSEAQATADYLHPGGDVPLHLERTFSDALLTRSSASQDSH